MADSYLNIVSFLITTLFYFVVLKPSISIDILSDQGKYKEYQEEYREINKEKIQEHYKENWSIKMTCECGCIFTTKNKIRHDKTKMHLNLLNRHNNKFE